MKWNIYILIITAMLCLAFTGLASANAGSVDVKCVWEPCGEKVDQGEIDAVYALIPAYEMRIVYTDADSNGEFGPDDTLYIDAIPDFDEVEVGDVRLTDSCDTYSPNTKVAHGDKDVGLRTKELPGEQAVVGFVDVNNDEVYDKGDSLYIDTDGDGKVSVNDVRLWADGYESYSRVTFGDGEHGIVLRDPLTYGYTLVTPIWYMLGYVDSDCSGDWTCVDKLYLQQLFNETAADGFSVADYFVTIGDFRLYIPPAAIAEEGWPECGTKVCQGDIDAVYTLTLGTYMQIMYADSNGNNKFDEHEGLYIDTIPELVGNPNGHFEVEAGDVRLVFTGNASDPNATTYEPNTKVAHGDGDLNDRLKELPGGQAVVGFVDVENDGVYDLADPLYVDTDDDGYVSIDDVRLTPVNGYEAYSRVEFNDTDLDGLLLDIVDGEPGIITPIWAMLGYIDSDCSLSWTCVDKLYLQQLPSVETRGFSMSEFFVTIGDLRLYIPPEAIANESWPECGTKVEQCNIDAVYVLIIDTDMRIMYADGNSNNRFDDDEGLYIDTFWDFDEVEVGDVRLTDYCGTYDPNTKVNQSDNDFGHTLKELKGGQEVIGFVDVENDHVYDLADPLYVDTDDDGYVSVNDVRLTEVNGYPAYSRVAIGDGDIGSDLEDILYPGQDPMTPIGLLLGYIDSDCSGDWTCPDKLYLQQYIICENDFKSGDVTTLNFNDGPCMHNYVVTIGDLRLYIPPEEIADNGETLVEVFDPMMYDANNNKMIEKDEVFAAIMDYFAEPALLTKDEVLEVIMVYFSYP